jgi:hypothetical protein
MSDLCDWAVIRKGIEEPCEAPAVAWRTDPREEFAHEAPFPACRRHAGAAFTVYAAAHDLLTARPDLLGVGATDGFDLARWAA